MNPIHPDDLPLFIRVQAAMQDVAKTYDLPLKSVEPMGMPAKGLIENLGECEATGHIRITMHAAVDGQWVDAPRTESKVWRTAAHELAHLRHFNHGVKFQEFQEELEQALANLANNRKDKLIAKLQKMQAARDGEAALGNEAAAEAFASVLNRMLIENELNESDLAYAKSAADEPIVEIKVDFGKYKIDPKKARIAWQENLAQVVAKAHLCKFLISKGNNRVWFVGAKSHATVAEYAYGTLVPATDKMAWKAYNDYFYGLRRTGGDVTLTRGFRAAWLDAFVGRIAERFAEARKGAVAEAVASTRAASTSTALMRLDGVLVRAQRYIDDKFSGRSRHAAALNGGRANHSDGRAAGRAAADAISLSKGIGAAGGRTARELKA